MKFTSVHDRFQSWLDGGQRAQTNDVPAQNEAAELHVVPSSILDTGFQGTPFQGGVEEDIQTQNTSRSLNSEHVVFAKPRTSVGGPPPNVF